MSKWSDLNQRIESCERCPRLIAHCEKVAETKRKAYLEDEYWGGPVANLGRANVPLLVVGLAPGAHGANRTGRMFTGDRSGDWLYQALFEAGFCNQPDSNSMTDGLKLKKCAITNICHCAPPKNKPNAQEIANCADFLRETIELCRPQVFLALGALAWTALCRYYVQQGWFERPMPKFAHGKSLELIAPHIKRPKRPKKKWLIGCYHPSQQNTFTGRLTKPMIDHLMAQVKNLIVD